MCASASGTTKIPIRQSRRSEGSSWGGQLLQPQPLLSRTPTFAQRDLAGMQKTLSALEARGLAVEIVHVGKRWQEDGVSFEVLHPPAIGPADKENARSLVLLVKHEDWSMLLTGDLEEEGHEASARAQGSSNRRANVVFLKYASKMQSVLVLAH